MTHVSVEEKQALEEVFLCLHKQRQFQKKKILSKLVLAKLLGIVTRSRRQLSFKK